MARSSFRCWSRAAATASCGTTPRCALRPDRSRRRGEEIPATAMRRRRLDADVRRAGQRDYQLRDLLGGRHPGHRRRTRKVIDHWRQGWLPGEDLAHVPLAAGQSVPLRFRWDGRHHDPPLALARRRSRSRHLVLLRGRRRHRLQFIYGPAIDRVVAGYRQITGAAPLMPRGAFGFWQSRERYARRREPRRAGRVSRARHPRRLHRAGLAVLASRRWGSHVFDRSASPIPARGSRDCTSRTRG